MTLAVVSTVYSMLSGCCYYMYVRCALWGFPGDSDGKESARNAGDPGLIPGSGIPWRINGNPLQCSYPENFMDREAWKATGHEATKS